MIGGRHAILRVAAVVAVACALVVGASPASSAPARQWRGVDTGNPWDRLPVAESVRDLREAAGLGSDTIRAVLRWEWLAPSRRGTYNRDRVQRIDRLMSVARSLDLRVVAVVAGTPCWATSAPGLPGFCNVLHATYPPRIAEDFGRYVSFVSRRWRRSLAALEIWNEPNATNYFRGSPSQYVELVRQASRAVERPSTHHLRIVAGAISGADTEYLQGLYDRHVERFSDAISMHPYDLPSATTFGDPTRRRPGERYSFASGIPAMHRTMVANGDRDPLWLTEFGVADCVSYPRCVSAGRQASYLAKAVELAATWRYVDTVLVFRLRDWHGPEKVTFGQNLGLLKRNFQPKPAARAVGEAFRRLAETQKARF